MIGNLITLFLCGDVMTGRGIDQILPYPCTPRIHESYVKDARDYVTLAEQANGPIAYPVDYAYIWGEALAELEKAAPDVRIINLETSITTSDEYWKGKGINYRMNPKNIPCIPTAGIDCCVLANNHVLDWGYSGLTDTLGTIRRAKMKCAGAGENLHEAETPAIFDVNGKGRVVVFAYGHMSSGVPLNWGAMEDKPGVNRLEDLSERSVSQIKQQIAEVKQSGDVVVASIHWGGNWGYDVPAEHMEFAHKLIDQAGVDILHGHSSHHVKGLEVYKGKLIIYGCGDFLNDYEGIGGYESYRSDLTLMYFPTIDPSTGQLFALLIQPMQIRNLRVHRATEGESIWLREVLNRESKLLGARVELSEDGSLLLARK